jgi:hypothetical protein
MSMAVDCVDPEEHSPPGDRALSISVDELEMSVRTKNILKRADIKYLGDLAQWTEASFLSLDGCGMKSVREARALLRQHGLAFGSAVGEWTAPPPPSPDTRPRGKDFAGFDEATRTKFLLGVKELGLSVRATNVLAIAGIEYVGELVGVNEGGLLKCGNCGRKTVEEIRGRLRELDLGFGIEIADWDRRTARAASEAREQAEALTAFRQSLIVIPPTDSLEEELLETLKAVVNDRDVEIAIKLFGWSGLGRRTLESVGQDYGVTRERIRQVSDRAIRKIRDGHIQMPWLLRAVEVIRNRCPATLEVLSASLQEAGVAKRAFDVTGVFAACVELGIAPGVELAMIGAARVYDRKDNSNRIVEIFRLCRRRTGARGCVNFDAICDELRVPEVRRESYRDLALVVGPNEWLDPDRHWLLCGGLSRNRLSNLVMKVLSIAPQISLPELRRAVAKSKRLEVAPPLAVLGAYITSAGLAAVSGNLVSSSTDFLGAIEPGGAEDTMVRVFQENGPILGWDRVQELCVGRGMNPTTVGIYLSNSSVIARLAKGIYSLVGSSVPPGMVEELAEAMSLSRKPAEFGWSSRGTLWCAIHLNRNILVSGSAAIPAFAADLAEGEWQATFGGVATEQVLKCRNHFVWSLSRILSNAGAEPGDVCVLEFDLPNRIVNLTVGGEDLADSWESGDIELSLPEATDASEFSEAQDEVAVPAITE